MVRAPPGTARRPSRTDTAPARTAGAPVPRAAGWRGSAGCPDADPAEELLDLLPSALGREMPRREPVEAGDQGLPPRGELLAPPTQAGGVQDHDRGEASRRGLGVVAGHAGAVPELDPHPCASVALDAPAVGDAVHGDEPSPALAARVGTRRPRGAEPRPAVAHLDAEGAAAQIDEDLERLGGAGVGHAVADELAEDEPGVVQELRREPQVAERLAGGRRGEAADGESLDEQTTGAVPVVRWTRSHVTTIAAAGGA